MQDTWLFAHCVVQEQTELLLHIGRVNALGPTRSTVAPGKGIVKVVLEICI
jgi:hypothetical protein